MFQKVRNWLGGAAVSARKCLLPVLAAVALVVGTQRTASATSIIPPIGVDSATMVTDAGTAVGTILLAVIGLGLAVAFALLAFRLVKRFAKG